MKKAYFFLFFMINSYNLLLSADNNDKETPTRISTAIDLCSKESCDFIEKTLAAARKPNATEQEKIDGEKALEWKQFIIKNQDSRFPRQIFSTWSTTEKKS